MKKTYLLFSLMIIAFSSLTGLKVSANNTGTLVDIGKAHYDKKEYAKAIEIWQKAAAMGSAVAMNNIGIAYKYGNGVPQNYQTAFNWLHKSSKKRYFRAYNNIGNFYLYGLGRPQNLPLAFDWFKAAADGDEIEGMFSLAECYRKGWGVKKNKNKAFEWYKKAADKGHVKAMAQLGFKYYSRKGDSLVSSAGYDPQKSLFWFKKSAKLGHANSMNMYGLFYEYGWAGVNLDYHQALYWYRKAANKGEKYAMSNIGEFYEKGLAVNQNYETALLWYNKAVNHGLQGANKSIARVTRKINNTQASASTSYASTGYNGKKVALLIANENYTNSENDLKNPVNDARLLSGKFRKLGYDVTVISNGSRVAMHQAINAFGKKSRHAESAVFYYSGHGMQNKHHENFLIPVNANITDEDSISYTSVNVKKIINKLDEANPKVSLVMLDACRNNKFSSHKGSRNFAVVGYETDGEMLVSYATKSGQVAKDGVGNSGNSPYAIAVSKQLDYASSTPLLQMFDNVRKEVKRLTNSSQSPTAKVVDMGYTTLLFKN